MLPSTFSISSASLDADKATVHLERPSSDTVLPYEVTPMQTSTEHLKLDTDLEIKEGQKVVVGRMGTGSQQALFVVLTVKVLQ